MSTFATTSGWPALASAQLVLPLGSCAAFDWMVHVPPVVVQPLPTFIGCALSGVPFGPLKASCSSELVEPPTGAEVGAGGTTVGAPPVGTSVGNGVSWIFGTVAVGNASPVDVGIATVGGPPGVTVGPAVLPLFTITWVGVN